MPISNTLTDGITEVDVIICGGGTAACVVAGRLAASDPELSVLVIEGGENNDGKPDVEHPGLFPRNLAPDSSAAIFYHGKKSSALVGRSPVVPTGGTLGGGSSVNLMLYSRAQGVDFDSWQMPGWSAKEIIPFMKRLETYRGRGKSNHGYDGPVQIGDGGFRGLKAQEDIVETAARLGYTIYDDLEDPERTNNGVERSMKHVTPDGRRADAAHSYLHPLLQDRKHPNLHVLCETKVVRVLFDGHKRAVGVECIPNPVLRPAINSTSHPKTKVSARKLVVLSCGALGTPLILERSGVGRSEVLAKASVRLVAELRGVGENYEDHQLVGYHYNTNLDPNDTNDALWRGDLSLESAEENGHLRWTGNDVHGKIRPTGAEVAEMGSEFQAAWDRDFKNRPNRPLIMLAFLEGFLGDPSTVPKGQYQFVAAYSAYSYSRGYIHITGPNWEDSLDFDPGFLTDANDIDLKIHIWTYKKVRAIMRSTKLYAGDLYGPNFPVGSEAAGSSPNPTYTAEDDKAIEKFIRENVGSTWHSLGTARMAPLEQNGVVDSNLNVYGVHGLKCCDLSIAPKMVSANTNNTAYVVGEKGADIILRELDSLREKSDRTSNGSTC